MILLDSDVVSTIMRLHLDPLLAHWLRRQSADQLMTSAPSVFDMRAGIESTPQGKRRRVLEAAFKHVIVSTLGNRIAPLDAAAAEAAGKLRAAQIASGRNVSVPDSQIAGIAQSLNVPLATRNSRDFADLGLHLINPWLR